MDSSQQGSNLAIGPGPGWVGVELVENLERVEISSLADEVVEVRKGKLEKKNMNSVTISEAAIQIDASSWIILVIVTGVLILRMRPNR